jgi:hypothetical protein
LEEAWDRAPVDEYEKALVGEWLGQLLRVAGEVDAVLAAHAALHEGLVAALGERHRRTLYAAADLGTSLAARGDAAAAESLLVATHSAQSEVLLIEHRDTIRTAEALEKLSAQAGGSAEIRE